MSNNKFEKLHAGLLCGICKQVFIDPYTFICPLVFDNHTFCYGCINHPHKCPECNTPCPFRAKKNRKIAELVDIYEKYMPIESKTERLLRKQERAATDKLAMEDFIEKCSPNPDQKLLNIFDFWTEEEKLSVEQQLKSLKDPLRRKYLEIIGLPVNISNATISGIENKTDEEIYKIVSNLLISTDGNARNNLLEFLSD